MVGADVKGTVGDDKVMGRFSVKERKQDGQMVVDFAKRMERRTGRNTEQHTVVEVGAQRWTTSYIDEAV